MDSLAASVANGGAILNITVEVDCPARITSITSRPPPQSVFAAQGGSIGAIWYSLASNLAMTTTAAVPIVNAPVPIAFGVAVNTFVTSSDSDATSSTDKTRALPSTAANISLPIFSSPPLPMTTEELRAHLEDLPRELYDEIRMLTFAFDFTSENRCIDRKKYKPPMQLQINKQLRTTFIGQYYGASADWVFVMRTKTDDHLRVAKSWRASLSAEAIGALRRPIHEFDGEGGRWVVYIDSPIEGGDGKRPLCISGRSICSKRIADPKGEGSSCWAWSPEPAEFGRTTGRFFMVGEP